MFKWMSILYLTGICLVVDVKAATPKPGASGVVKQKLPNCNQGIIGFSAVGGITIHESKLLGFKTTLLNYEDSWNQDGGIFTCVCPGIYEINFSVVCGEKSRGILEKRVKTSNWQWVPLLATTNGGGSGSVLYPLEVGEQIAIIIDGKPPELGHSIDTALPPSSFNAHRISNT